MVSCLQDHRMLCLGGMWSCHIPPVVYFSQHFLLAAVGGPVSLRYPVWTLPQRQCSHHKPSWSWQVPSNHLTPYIPGIHTGRQGVQISLVTLRRHCDSPDISVNYADHWGEIKSVIVFLYKQRRRGEWSGQLYRLNPIAAGEWVPFTWHDVHIQYVQA